MILKKLQKKMKTDMSGNHTYYLKKIQKEIKERLVLEYDRV